MSKKNRLNEHHILKQTNSSWFGDKAEEFARFFGTPVFIIIQTFVVSIWIILNVAGVFHFDLYPFILLNLAFSLQAAYAAPLILLAQTRQADRDKVHSIADAEHREAIAAAQEDHNRIHAKYMEHLLTLHEVTQDLVMKIDALTVEVHEKLIPQPVQFKEDGKTLDLHEWTDDNGDDWVRLTCRWEKCKKIFNHKLKVSIEDDMKYCPHCGNKQ